VRILLDECVNAGVCKAFPGHAVKTVAQSGWRGTDDGPLLILAQEQFDVFVTIDSNLEHQQNLKKFNLGFVIVSVRSNEINSYLHLFAQLKEAAESVSPSQVIHIVSPEIRG
jgi:predicted nuclease of predicted toxin-antitoxin system